VVEVALLDQPSSDFTRILQPTGGKQKRPRLRDALENAGRQPAQIYRESVLYTTLSPCAMCTGAVLLYGIPHVVIGENETFRGEEDLLRSRGLRLQVLQDSECISLMREFLASKPDLWREDIGV
jgi:cytosine/creatinine deaminase